LCSRCLKKIDTTPTLAKITPLDDSSPQDQSPTQITIEDNHSMYSNEVKFQVENARVGQFYNSKISISSAHDFNKIRFKAESFRFGKHDFYFDEESKQYVVNLNMPKSSNSLSNIVWIMQPIQAVASLISSQIHVVYGRCLNLKQVNRLLRIIQTSALYLRKNLI
jgi:hypothetical protein